MRTLLPTLFVVLLLVAACGDKEPGDTPSPPPPASPTAEQPSEEPTKVDHISVDHILIGVKNPRFPNGKYTEDDARILAYRLVEELTAGADWQQLKTEHSEDPPPGGPYDLANHGVEPSHQREFRRAGMVPAFGDVGFGLKVGEIGIADFDEDGSPFGFHIIKRVK